MFAGIAAASLTACAGGAENQVIEETQETSAGEMKEGSAVQDTAGS